LDQFADFALAAVGHCLVPFHDPLTVGFDSNWGKYLPPILYRHAGHHGILSIKSASSP
jgi:hypothetical protein